MCCAANVSFANRQVILHRNREVFAQIFDESPEALGIRSVYDVAHNTVRFERFATPRGERSLLVHRKGATRALPPGHPGKLARSRVRGRSGPRRRARGARCRSAAARLSPVGAVPGAPVAPEGASEFFLSPGHSGAPRWVE
jgi:tRNA-splicing ligase RtcB